MRTILETRINQTRPENTTTTTASGRLTFPRFSAGWPDDPDTLPLLHDRATTNHTWEVWRAAAQTIIND